MDLKHDIFRSRCACACGALIPCFAAGAVPSEYTLTNITGWSAGQLATLPHFDRYVPLAPAGAGGDFAPLAHNGAGLTAGNRNYNNGGWVQGSGAYVKDGVQTDVSAWRASGNLWSYSWSYTYWDGTDYHFQNGFVTHSPAEDLNIVGQVVGYATIPGAGSGAGSSSGYSDHIWLRDTETGVHSDLTPDATRAEANSINDLGEIAGFWRNATETHPFIRHADGSFEDFTLNTATSHGITPTVINNQRLVAGNAIVYTTPIRDQRPWVCESGTSVTQLPLPSQNSPDVGTIIDGNDHGILVGEAHKAAAFTETSGVRWSKSGGSWQAEDLNELLSDNMDFIVDRALAVNDAGHILCSGHADGTDTLNTHKLLLTPDSFPAPAVTTLPATDVTATSATLRAKVNAANRSTTAIFEHGSSTSYGTTSSIAPVSGTVPVLAELEITGLSPNTTYHFRATGTSGGGTTDGADMSFTTPWDWASWSAAEGLAGPHADANQNGVPDLVDFATGDGPRTVFSSDGFTSTLVFPHSLLASGVTLTVQVSDDLEVWIDGPSYPGGGSNADATETARLETSASSETITISTTHPYARLRVSMP